MIRRFLPWCVVFISPPRPRPPSHRRFLMTAAVSSTDARTRKRQPAVARGRGPSLGGEEEARDVGEEDERRGAEEERRARGVSTRSGFGASLSNVSDVCVDVVRRVVRSRGVASTTRAFSSAVFAGVVVVVASGD